MKNFTKIEKGALTLIILALIVVGIYYLNCATGALNTTPLPIIAVDYSNGYPIIVTTIAMDGFKGSATQVCINKLFGNYDITNILLNMISLKPKATDSVAKITAGQTFNIKL